ncbi:MAG: DUF3124 domain-containing protein [Saprospiraceae bacterium]|nr:DUF3124 domain-containing protein [Saprospiraceae bacterium]
MKQILFYFTLMILFATCIDDENAVAMRVVNFDERTANIQLIDSLITGKTYLPVYSHIYHFDNNTTHSLTVTISMRNISPSDTIYVQSANYYNTYGEWIREYLQHPIYLSPLETVEIVINAKDREGGSGANFVFDWAVHSEKNLPLFESVMISTSGQQGLSFSSRGVRIYD